MSLHSSPSAQIAALEKLAKWQYDTGDHASALETQAKADELRKFYKSSKAEQDEIQQARFMSKMIAAQKLAHAALEMAGRA